MGTTAVLTWQFTTSSKCSTQRFNLSLSLCKMVPSSATRVDKAGLENFFCKKCKSFIRGLLNLAVQLFEPDVELLQHVYSTKSS